MWRGWKCLNNRLIFSGITSDYENFRVDENKFIVRDNNGKILLLDLTSGSVSNNGEYEYSYNILNDLSNTEYIEIIKASGNNVIEDENGYLLKASAIDETNANRSNDIISRKPTKEELNDGYALSSVNYNVDIDKSVAFETIDSLIDKEIAINNTDKIIVKEIVPHDDYTEVVMKIDGNYNYRLLSSIVLFDEDMNDSCAFEGSTAIMNDIEEKIVQAIINIYKKCIEDEFKDIYQNSKYAYKFIMDIISYFFDENQNKILPTRIESSKKFIEENYNKLIGLDDIANHINLSKFHFTREFEKEVGMTPGKYIIKIRLKKAIELLTFSKDMTIEEIAIETGFNCGNYFSKVFKKYIGISPSAYRMSNNYEEIRTRFFD